MKYAELRKDLNQTVYYCDNCKRGYVIDEEKENILTSGLCIACQWFKVNDTNLN